MASNTYDTALFIDIICTEGATLVGSTSELGLHVEHYCGRNGNIVSICIEDDELSVTVAKQYLDKLGMYNLAPLIFTN